MPAPSNCRGRSPGLFFGHPHAAVRRWGSACDRQRLCRTRLCGQCVRPSISRNSRTGSVRQRGMCDTLPRRPRPVPARVSGTRRLRNPAAAPRRRMGRGAPGLPLSGGLSTRIATRAGRRARRHAGFDHGRRIWRTPAPTHGRRTGGTCRHFVTRRAAYPERHVFRPSADRQRRLTRLPCRHVARARSWPNRRTGRRPAAAPFDTTQANPRARAPGPPSENTFSSGFRRRPARGPARSRQ